MRAAERSSASKFSLERRTQRRQPAKFEFLDDEQNLDAAEVPAVHRNGDALSEPYRSHAGRDALFDTHPRARPSSASSRHVRREECMQEHTQMNNEQLNAALEAEATRGTAMVKGMQTTATETIDIARATGEQLVAQTEQLEHVRDAVESTRRTAQDAKPIVEKLRHNKLSRMVRKPFTGGQKLRDQHSLNKAAKDSNTMASARNRRDHEGFHALGKSIAAQERAQNTAISTGHQLDSARGRKVSPAENVASESYADIKNESVRKALVEQDNGLDDISTKLAELNQYAAAFAVELDYQAAVIDSIDAEGANYDLQEVRTKLRRV